jgi:hypothetical protein
MLSVSAGTADATDVDLLAIRFNVPLSEEKLIVDCKDRRKPRPFERVLWTVGLASFAKANQSVVVLPRALWQVRDFAAQGGVQVLEAFEIERHLRSNSSSSLGRFSDADPSIASQRAQSSDRDLYRERLKLRQMLILGHPLTNLNRIVRTLSQWGRKLKGDETDDWSIRDLCFDAAVIAAVMIIRFACETKWTPEKDWADYARKKLTYGDVSPQKAQELARLALDRELPEGIPAPPYTAEVIRVLAALRSNPEIAARLPYYLDYYLFGYIVRESHAGYRTAPLTDSTGDGTLKLTRRILSALSYAAGVPSAIWSGARSNDGGASSVISKPKPEARMSNNGQITPPKKHSQNAIFPLTDSPSDESSGEYPFDTDNELKRVTETDDAEPISLSRSPADSLSGNS